MMKLEIVFCIFLLICVNSGNCQEQSSSTPANEPQKPEKINAEENDSKPQISKIKLTDTFFGKIDDHLEQPDEIAKQFFKDLSSLELFEERIAGFSSDGEQKKQKTPPAASEDGVDNGRKTTSQNSQIRGKGIGAQQKSFSCTKRALLLYKLTINTIYQRLRLLSSQLIAESHENLHSHHEILLQLSISTTDIHKLHDHLSSLQSLFSPSQSPPKSSSTTDQTVQFCRNLDSIEAKIIAITNRISIVDSGSSKKGSRIFEFWYRFQDSVKLAQFWTWLVVVAILWIVLFWLFPKNATRRKQAVFVIVALVLMHSMYQFYQKQQREYRAKQEERFQQRVHRMENQCWFTTKILSWTYNTGYQCFPPSSSSPSPPPPQPPSDDFHENFNILEFLSQFAVAMTLSPIKELTTGLYELFEQLLEGGQSDDWYSPGAWARSIMYSTILRPVFVILALYAVWKLAIALGAMKSFGFVWGLVSGDEHDGQQQIQNPNSHHQLPLPDRSGSHLPSTASTSMTYHIQHVTVNYSGRGIVDSDSATFPHFLSHHQSLPRLDIMNSDEEDCYFSADEAEELSN